MGKLRCPCGNVISSVAHPNIAIGNVVTQWELDGIPYNDDNAARGAIDDGREVWECSDCGRLAFSYPKRDDNTVKWYSPDDGKPGHLMRPADQVKADG